MDAAASRKRPRDEEEEEEVAKKQQRVLLPINNYEDEEEKRYEFHEGIGVFDFPWLKVKEGVLFFSSLEEDGDDQDKTFAPPSNSYLEDDHIHESSQNLCVDGDDDDDDDDGFWSLLVDDLDPVDCIWRCVIDHPLDLGFNKG